MNAADHEWLVVAPTGISDVGFEFIAGLVASLHCFTIRNKLPENLKWEN